MQGPYTKEELVRNATPAGNLLEQTVVLPSWGAKMIYHSYINATLWASCCATIVKVLLVCDLNHTPAVMAKRGSSCVHFAGIATCGRTSWETVSHPQCPPLPTLYKISLIWWYYLLKNDDNNNDTNNNNNNNNNNDNDNDDDDDEEEEEEDDDDDNRSNNINDNDYNHNKDTNKDNNEKYNDKYSSDSMPVTV